MAKNTYDYPVYLFNEGTNFEAYKLFTVTNVQKQEKDVAFQSVGAQRFERFRRRGFQ